MAYGRNIQAMEMYIGGIEGGFAAIAAGLSVAGLEAQGGGLFDLPGRVVLVTVVSVAILIDRVSQGEPGVKSAILRGNGVGVFDHGPGSGTSGTVGRGRKARKRTSAEYDCQQPAHMQVLPNFLESHSRRSCLMIAPAAGGAANSPLERSRGKSADG